MIVRDLGRMDYTAAEALQRELVDAVAMGGDETLLLVEHPPVVTLGRHGGAEHLLLSETDLAARGVSVARTARGGSVTCHFPGQLVAYPILDLRRRKGGVRMLVHNLEGALIAALADLGVTAERQPERPGVWVDERKVASLGIAVRRMVTWHGVSLNVGLDVTLFEVMNLCGLRGAGATSVALELARTGTRSTPDMDSVKHVVTTRLVQALGG